MTRNTLSRARSPPDHRKLHYAGAPNSARPQPARCAPGVAVPGAERLYRLASPAQRRAPMARAAPCRRSTPGAPTISAGVPPDPAPGSPGHRTRAGPPLAERLAPLIVQFDDSRLEHSRPLVHRVGDRGVRTAGRPIRRLGQARDHVCRGRSRRSWNRDRRRSADRCAGTCCAPASPSPRRVATLRRACDTRGSPPIRTRPGPGPRPPP
jgi:hypothetical protein